MSFLDQFDESRYHPRLCKKITYKVKKVETWPSGRRHFPAKEAYGQNLYRGFESLSLRQIAAVAQLDRVLGYEPRGRGFDSCQPHQFKSLS
jgi:hypothetical protein